ncbi:MAG: photosystem II reaction center protein Ycf12 [Saprospiraceae bacterium]|nr:photosystem II reaction center protein Ycf12 [Saprospiraceae bacterium]MBL0023769.1 photosystem II reaction center protein Ycf12 [Saprospiraceae bacterium]
MFTILIFQLFSLGTIRLAGPICMASLNLSFRF